MVIPSPWVMPWVGEDKVGVLWPLDDVSNVILKFPWSKVSLVDGRSYSRSLIDWKRSMTSYGGKKL